MQHRKSESLVSSCKSLNICKRLWILSFARNMGKNIGKNISDNLSSKYCHKLIDHAKQSTTDALKSTSKRAIQNTTEGTGDLIDKIADEITKVSRSSS